MKTIEEIRDVDYVTDFFNTENDKDKIIIKGLLYEWNEGEDVEDSLSAYLKDEYTLQDVALWYELRGF